MAATIDDTAVVARLSNQDNFLAVKLKSGSANYTHFAQIYQFVPVPSLFFIGRNGTPLEVVCAGVQATNLATRIDRILEEHYKERPIMPSTSAENVREQTVNFLQTEARVTHSRPAEAREDNTEQVSEKSVEKKPSEEDADSSAPPAKLAKTDHSPEYEVVCKDDVCVRQVKAKPDEPGPSQSVSPPAPAIPDASQKEMPIESESTASMEERMDRAKELIEARRREKSDKEKEAEKQKEIERRSQGKGVAELKRWQADQELKQIQEERKREKMENNLARQRILEQIAQDRAERRARDAPPATSPTATTAPTPHNSAQPATSGDSGGRARLQFKLPDGSSHTAHFPAHGPLSDVQRYIADNLQLSTSSFSLWTAFPRRELTESSASLLGLQLAPSAALLVLPRRAAPTIATTNSFTALFTYFTQLFTTIILEPSQQFYEWLRTRLFPPPPTTASREPSPSPPQPPQPSLGNLRRRGNIHRLPSDRPTDDDNNTWNGNSTQQM